MGIGSIDQVQNLRLIGLFGPKNSYNDDHYNGDDYSGDDYNGDGFRAKFPQFSNTHNQQQSMSLTIIMMMDIFIFSAYRPALCNTICTNVIELQKSSQYKTLSGFISEF